MGVNEEKGRRGERKHAGAIKETGGRSGTSVVWLNDACIESMHGRTRE